MSAENKTADADTTSEDKLDEPLRQEGYRALLAEREANKELKAQLKEFQEKFEAAEAEKLSKEEAAIKRAEAAEAKLTELETERELTNIRAEVAKAKGVPADLLLGSDKASIEAFADKLKDFTGPKKPEPNPFLGSDQGKTGDSDTNAKAVLGFA